MFNVPGLLIWCSSVARVLLGGEWHSGLQSKEDTAGVGMLRSAGHGAEPPAGLLPSFSPGGGGDCGGFAAMRERLAQGPRGLGGLGGSSRGQQRLWGTLATGACAALLVSLARGCAVCPELCCRQAALAWQQQEPCWQGSHRCHAAAQQAAHACAATCGGSGGSEPWGAVQSTAS